MNEEHAKTLFPTLTAEQIDWLNAHGVELSLPSGTVLFAQDSPAEQFYVVLEGEVQVTQRTGDSESVITVHRPGQFTGELSLLTSGARHIATGRAIADIRVRKIPVDDLRKILIESPDLAETILSAMACRVQNASELMRQREKLAALGKLSAGLAHELNNPASAVLRSVRQLQSNLTVERELYRELTDVWADASARRHAESWVARLETRLNLQTPSLEGRTGDGAQTPDVDGRSGEESKPEGEELMALPPPVNPLEASDREDRLISWMEAREVREPWRIAPPLAESHVEAADLDELAAGIGRVDLSTVLAWAAAALTVDSMVRTAQQSARRVTELVAAIKTYSHMDEADYQETDLHEGLDSTLTILGHKLKDGIEIRREYDRNLPKIGAYGSELNQVWTNLIDNAIDAVRESRGHRAITLRTGREGEYALVQIVDNGAGIPDDILPRIFDPFFTTKGVGEGTGLGLEIAYQIVVRHHHGDIRAVSENGQTRFEVRLPFRQSGRQG